MKTSLAACVALTLFTVLHGQSLLTGKTEAEVFAEKGKPVSKSVAGKRAIYRWDDAQITFHDGRAVKVEPRNQTREQELRQHSANAAKEAAQRKAEIETKNIKDKQRADMIVAQQLQAEQEAKEQAERQKYLDRQAVFQEKAKRDAENQKTKQLPVRPTVFDAATGKTVRKGR